MDSLFRFEKVTKRYHYTKVDVISNVSLEICEGQTITLLMQVQSGKTTMAKLLMGLEKPTSGKIFFRQTEYKDAPKDKGIAFLPAQPVLFANKSIAYNLAYPLLIRKGDKVQVDNQVEQVAQKYRFSDLNKKAKQLTLEEQFRLCVCRASLRPLNLIILDAPTEQNLQMAEQLAEEKKCALLILTEDISLAKGSIIVIYGNSIAHEGTLQSAKDFLSERLWADEKYVETLSADLERQITVQNEVEKEKTLPVQADGTGSMPAQTSDVASFSSRENNAETSDKKNKDK